MHTPRRASFAPLLLALVSAGCASSPATAPPASPQTPDGAAPAAMDARPADADWGTFRLKAPPLDVQLPELSVWQRGAGRVWFSLEHAPSESTLDLWFVRAERTARPTDCEARARITRPDLWRPEPETTIDRHTLDSPVGYRTEVVVGIDAEPSEEADQAATLPTPERATRDTVVVGYVLAFGATPGRCLGIHFVTRARGVGAEAQIGHRLDLVARRIIPSITPRSVEDRIASEPER